MISDEEASRIYEAREARKQRWATFRFKRRLNIVNRKLRRRLRDLVGTTYDWELEPCTYDITKRFTTTLPNGVRVQVERNTASSGPLPGAWYWDITLIAPNGTKSQSQGTIIGFRREYGRLLSGS